MKAGREARDGAPEDADDARLRALLDEYGRVLRRAVVRLCPRHLGIHADEIEQEARIRLWQALQREKNVASPASYLYRIAVTATIDAVRRVKARREEQLHADEADVEAIPASAIAPASSSPDRLAARGQLMRRIDEAMAQLPEGRRQAVRLHLQGFTPVEIGGLMGWTPDKGRNLVYRGLDDLRARLQAAGIDYEAD